MNAIDPSEMPYDVKVIEHTWIPMRDGCRLAARIWIPEGAEEDPVPAVLEYIPYRKRDIKRLRDTEMHAYFAGHGYASVRVDIRGSGDSEGVLSDEYLPQELDDGEDILQWLEEQPWCNGRVGIIGISWGGFNGLQIAARQPRQLQAVVTVCSTDDRYADDIHYMGGCLLNNNLSWASTMFAFNSLPPDPEIVGDRWKEMWMDRLENSGLWLEKWMKKPHRNEYWKHGSICENYGDVQCPVMAVSGWADGYSNSVFRLMEHLNVPKKGLVGPWSHKYPHDGVPGPAIGFLQEVLRWWDHWLKDQDTGMMKEPMIHSWMQDSFEPKTKYDKIPGRWIGEEQWPPPKIESVRYPLAPGKILMDDSTPDSASESLTIQSPLNVGLFAGKWYSSGDAPDLPYDQRLEDGGSLVFESEALVQKLEIHGSPAVELELSADKPVAMIAVRLSDISPDQKATRVTYGLLNLCHRHSHEHPEPLTPGKKERVKIHMNEIAHSFQPGHRFRISVSTVYWPLAWPSPEPVTLTIDPYHSQAILPVRPSNQEVDSRLTSFPSPESAKVEPPVQKSSSEQNWLITHDLGKESTTLKVIQDGGELYFADINLNVVSKTEEWYTYEENRYDSLRGEVHSVRGLSREGWSVRTVTRTVLTCDQENFYVHATLDAYEKDRRVFSKTWDETIKRQLL
ncbi:hypothetical protein C8P63_10369 [Melghirimyces profundicolus]|uniref:Xaa-Pro dipeptidyl-peptidase C-terminal domain-containing protein n=1 Tax=Melghirimyces profundicolus TaxID=1242148 RepID=A0A2T6C7N9_9BACL|nr:CocE/NonD family hydrolase [Melghirimyces profundicolus]PTX64286.1 hypothetical protein C8P63_10369 [Melghirimyces profundicolus]